MADVPFAFIRDMMAAALGVEAHLLRPPYKDAQEFDYRLSRILRADFDYKDIFSASAMHGLEEGTVYYVHNTLELNYVFMPVPGPKPRSVLLFGPFLYEAASGPFFERVLAQNRIGKGDAAALRTFYGTVPEVAEPTMAAAAHAVACQLYGAHDPARVVHRTLASTVTGRAQPDEAFQFSMELLERRYRDENALLAAVSRGDYDEAVRHLGRFPIKNFTPRTGELLRDVKNMLIVVNTLLGGLVVIPFYWLYANRPFGLPGHLYLVLGLFCVIYINLLFGAHSAIQPAAVVYFVVMFTVTKDRYVSYTIARILGTGVGVLAGLAINRLFPAPRDARDTEDAEAMREDASSHARRAKKTHPARRHWGGFSGKGRASY